MSEQKIEIENLQDNLISMFSNRNLTNKCDICDNVLKTISTFLNTLKIIIIVKKRYFDTKINYKFTPILFTKLANVTCGKSFPHASHQKCS